jgi:hypothetical protein
MDAICKWSARIAGITLNYRQISLYKEHKLRATVGIGIYIPNSILVPVLLLFVTVDHDFYK